MTAYKKWLIRCLVLLAFHPLLQAQMTYHLKGSLDIPLFSIGLSSGVSGYAIGRHVEPLSPAEIASLDRNDLLRIDRKATYWYSNKANKASNAFFYSATLAPLILLADKNIRQEAGVISVLYLETLTLNAGLTELTKNLVKRSRPYTYNPEVPLEIKQYQDARKSFFSGHTSSTAASCFFAAKVWSDFHPDSRWKPLVWTTAATIPAVTGYLRMHAGKHFFTDVIVGYAVGATLGYFIPVIHHMGKAH